MCVQTLLALWNGGLMELSKTYKIECVKNINSVILKAVLARCDEDSKFYWHELFDELEKLLITIIEKNSEGRRHLQIVVDREILCIIHKINDIQNKEEKHYKYLEKRKQRRPHYYERSKHKKKHKHNRDDSDSSCSESDNDD